MNGGWRGELSITGKRLLQSIAWEIAGLALLVAFVVLISTMPPLSVLPRSDALFGYRIYVDTAQWQQTATQYWGTIRSGSLGQNRAGIPVADLIRGKLGTSLTLLGLALTIALSLGVLKGVRDFQQLRRRRLGLGPLITGLVQGLPDFWVAIMLQVLCVEMANHFDWHPFPVVFDDRRPSASLFYPVVCLSLIPLAYVARITSTALSSVWEQEYIRTARAKGLREWEVVYRHALRSALVQILDGLPNAVAVISGNLMIVEYLFRVPGITMVLKDAVTPATSFYSYPRKLPPPDVPVLIAAGVLLGLIFAVLYLACSSLRRLVDPRLRERDQS